MKRRKPGKALDKAARALLDSDEFAAHIANIAALYRREREQQEAPQRQALRQALRSFERPAAMLALWMKQAQASRGDSSQHLALKLIRERTASSGALPTDDLAVRDWLSRAATSAAHAAAEMKSSKQPDAARLVRMAADALKATFEHHGLKWSTSIVRGEPAPALSMLWAIARDGGDKSVTVEELRRALRTAPTAQ